MPWKAHIGEITEALSQAGEYPMAVIVGTTGGVLDRIKTVKGALIVLASTFAAGMTFAVASWAVLGGVLSAPQDIEELREYTAETRAQVRSSQRDMDLLVSRMDTLICELREERTGTMPPDCQRGILVP